MENSIHPYETYPPLAPPEPVKASLDLAQLKEKVNGFIQEKPGLCLGLALLSGAILGCLLKRR